ncbi:Bifunctional proline dehydrogenase/L-glutamate gamma-semialdehyde dehydrogenase PutA [Candidatus Bealeia paramacronuclearis]|uniref:Bifunctional protein PutA n=1 Tax=Candidatus Bealeia paramacronuclearis TaxID=1921001 RepID=A0ABZ2C3L4_9PROT|nr:Bifunctional proline dehydrogenase/L-glutamate gamma-semialdehyde dehydrogenase PutA [Candidatus Bealeia paramacronuclearis]
MTLRFGLPEFQNDPLFERLQGTYRAPEEKIVAEFLETLNPFYTSEKDQIRVRAGKWVEAVRTHKLSSLNVQSMLQVYPLSSERGRSIMSLAEALLRIPDSYTAGLLIRDKISELNWSATEAQVPIQLAGWGLEFLRKFILEKESKLLNRLSDPFILRVFKIGMQQVANQFILGTTIEKAIKRAEPSALRRYSYDMLGEGARTWEMAHRYKGAYLHAIETLKSADHLEAQSISVKLSALHPKYFVGHAEDVLKNLVPTLIEIAEAARSARLAMTIDAEEVARLELSLEVMDRVMNSESLKAWNGFGLAVQAYQKRMLPTLDWLCEKAQSYKMPLNVRLVKGAYWDTEIKLDQVAGLSDYALFTKKSATDISYLRGAQRIFEGEGHLRPQFATHNAFTISSVIAMAKGRRDYEFQRLQGMGEPLYQAVQKDYEIPCRIYAPVGEHQDLLAYLVRRLLENGANSSFVNKIYDADLAISSALDDPFQKFEKTQPSRNHNIPLPSHMYGDSRRNSKGFDMQDISGLRTLESEIQKVSLEKISVNSRHSQGERREIINPGDSKHVVGGIQECTLEDLENALELAHQNWESWEMTPASKRAEILEKASQLFEKNAPRLLGLLQCEGGKTLADAISELREAVDFCRYYANQAILDFENPTRLPGPTGEVNTISLRGRGVFACISPWNFPLAIFIGQVTAALASGNAVIAKPASQTPLIAAIAIELLHEAGVPQNILHFLPGKASLIGNMLVSDSRISGVVFTGSTKTAKHINAQLANRNGPLVPLIAETGGLNAMIVDSSALPEQVVDSVIISAFQSAGQRCSALRILYLQEDIYDTVMPMLIAAMKELKVGNPSRLESDLGPVIDKATCDEIEEYLTQNSKRIIARGSVPSDLQGSYIAPAIVKLSGIEELEKEVFGPVLHVAKFKARELDQVISQINEKGYGLTMGVMSRIESTISHIQKHAHVGNLYINRSMIGAVVGVQPFGGEGLSGTGPKAGGPFYLHRFAVERTFTDNITAMGGNPELLTLGEG